MKGNTMRTGTKTLMHILLIALIIFETGSGLSQSEEKLPKNPLFFKFSISLPGKTEDSYFKGTYTVKSGGKFITRGNVFLKGLVTPKTRSFERCIASADTIDLANDGLDWSIKGSIYDSSFKETFPVSSWNMSTFSNPVDGIGFIITLGKDKRIFINNKIFNKKEDK